MKGDGHIQPSDYEPFKVWNILASHFLWNSKESCVLTSPSQARGRLCIWISLAQELVKKICSLYTHTHTYTYI